MQERISFGKKDIGAEILPILTTGLYRDTLDTLREYIQNAIDAQCKHLEVIIDPDTVTVADDGFGMTFEEAKKALRLGISEKNPLENVGFRGIGIYSAFNLCDNLDIYTRSDLESACYVVRFNFKNIRKALQEEQERRKQDKPPSLYLEKLLKDSVYVEVDSDNTQSEHGTTAIMSGLSGDVYRLNNWAQVVRYLQDVVPLPFQNDFKYASEIQKKFEQEDYRVVPLTLQIGNQREQVWRPYYNEIFAHGGEHPPEFFDIADGKERFGFAWVCINDARRVLKDDKIRGLLIKKFGFSISDRNYLEPFFARPVFNRRITGEVIVQHPNLLPNAARSDFEHNSPRQIFLQTALPKFVSAVSDWANRIQEEDKAKEVLAEVLAKVLYINKVLPSSRQDKERLLQFNIGLYELAREIRPHARTLKRIRAQQFAEVEGLIKECQKMVASDLIEQKKSQRSNEERIIRSIQREAAEPKTEAERLRDIPKNLLALIEAYGLSASPELIGLLGFLDENYLQIWLAVERYEEMLVALREFMEEQS